MIFQSPSITSKEVREYLCDFSMYDRNGDGVLNYWEFEPIAHLYMPEYRAMDVLKKYSDLYCNFLKCYIFVLKC